MNTKPTSDVIREAARVMAEYSNRMHRLAEEMDDKEDLSYSGEAINMIANMIANIRMDLLITRPIREYQRNLQND